MRVILLLVFFVPLFAITNVGGLITENTVWGPTGNPPDSVYNLISQVEVVDSVSLTIQPGTRIQSVTYGFLIYGNLFACGTPEDKVLFTSANVSPNPGDWMGLWFINSYSDTNLIKDCIIEYAQEGIRCEYSILELEDSRISFCSYDGIVCNNSVEIINCEITDNTIAGIRYSIMNDSAPGIIANNTINNNKIGLFIETVWALPRFTAPNSFLNNDSSIVIWGSEVHIVDTVQWNPTVGGIDTWVGCKIQIDSSGVLDIAPGNIFKFHAGAWIEVNGRLFASGTESDSIIFTSANTTPAIGDWHGIHHYGQELPDTCILSYCIIEYADEIHINPVRIEHTSIRYLHYGAWCGGLISNSDIHDNLTGIHFSWFPLHINSNIIRNNNTGIYIEPLLPSGIGLPYFDIPNQFRNNTRDIYISIMNVHIIDDYYWNPSIDSVHCFVEPFIDIDTTGTFRIAPGNHFHLSGIMAYGTIIAEGEDGNMIYFSSISGNPVPGDWSGIVLCGPSTNSRFMHCTIKYAQDGINAVVPFIIDSSTVDSCHMGLLLRSGSISNCDVIGNTADGIFCALQDSVDIAGCVITGNQTGIGCYDGALPNIYNNQIYGNTEWGVFNMENNYWIMAEHNWWGDSTGPCDTSAIDTLYNPGGLGDRVSYHVDYDPWLYWPGIEEVGHNYPVINPATSGFSVSNPFVKRAIISYILEKDQFVSLNIYNALGQLVRDLENIRKKKGNYVVIWDGNDNLLRQLPGGIYWCKINCEDLNYTQKIVKLN